MGPSGPIIGELGQSFAPDAESPEVIDEELAATFQRLRSSLLALFLKILDSSFVGWGDATKIDVMIVKNLPARMLDQPVVLINGFGDAACEPTESRSKMII